MHHNATGRAIVEIKSIMIAHCVITYLVVETRDAPELAPAPVPAPAPGVAGAKEGLSILG